MAGVQAIMRDSAGVLHMVGSGETGWSANAAHFLTSPNASLVGAVWNNDFNPSGSGNTYDSQSTFFFPFKHADGHVTHMCAPCHAADSGVVYARHR